MATTEADKPAKRKIFAGGKSPHLAFAELSGRIIKVSVLTTTPDLLYDGQHLETSRTSVDVQLDYATEADLLAIRKLAPRNQRGQLDGLLKIVRKGEQSAATAETMVQQAARDYMELAEAVCVKRQITTGSQTSCTAFQLVGATPVRMDIAVKSPPIFYQWGARAVEMTPPEITICIRPATEGDLTSAKKVADRSQVGELDRLLELVKQPAAPPRGEKIVKPKARLITILRSSNDGKMTGALVTET